MLPDHITFILLSATVPNTKEFAEWVGEPEGWVGVGEPEPGRGMMKGEPADFFWLLIYMILK